ncbi:MAG: cytochrome c3 family protein [Deltaproteobacteria bacterium]|nr:cytochrome c3 family protein [Deltaproteobacteria bacterium]
MEAKKFILWTGSFIFVLASLIMTTPALGITSQCEECHTKITPGIVKDFGRSLMSEDLTCTNCHGSSHITSTDVQKAKLPTINTCKKCHSDKVAQYMSGKHALGLLAITAFPKFAHRQPKSFIAGQKGCNGCHNLGITNTNIRKSELRLYYKYGMDCQNCHTRHAFSKKEALRPEACNSCHTGFDHAQWEMWYHSKHGSAFMVDPKAHRGPTCQDCHMSNGDHRVMTSWGFLALRLPEKDKEWLGYRLTILKALGVLDEKGAPSKRLKIFKDLKLARLTRQGWQAERDRMLGICQQCHCANFVKNNLENADSMIKAADKIFAEAINIVTGLYKDGIIKRKTIQPTFLYPDLFMFYEVNTHIEELLYEMFMDYRMKTYQAAFHIMPDYTTWYGYAKMKETLIEVKGLSKQMRLEAKMQRK